MEGVPQVPQKDCSSGLLAMFRVACKDFRGHRILFDRKLCGDLGLSLLANY